MFAIKCMVITFSVLSIIRMLPDDYTEYYRSTGRGILTIMGTLLVAFVVGMVILSVDDFLLYPLMGLSVIISFAGLIISMACGAYEEDCHNQFTRSKMEFHTYFKKHGTLPPVPPPPPEK